METVKKYWKYAGLCALFVIIIGMISWSDRAPAPAVAAPTAEQLEQQDLIQRIESGSVLWAQAKAKEDAAHAERVRQEQGNAGYRHTLCTKFQKVVTASGAVVDATLSADGTSCITAQGF